MFDEFFSKAHELSQQGIPFAMAMVVRAKKPTSGKAGDKALITADGELFGWIGGSCAQPTVVKEAIKALQDGHPRFIRLSPNPLDMIPREGLTDFAMTCFSGGTLEIYIEPQLPKPRLLIVGNLPIARSLIELGTAMNYEVVAVDPDGDLQMHDAHRVLNSLDEIAGVVHSDTYAVVATHGNFDEIALEKVVQAKPFYIGLVASRKRFESVLEYLVAQNVDSEALKAIKSPAGLDIQAKRSDEIALSIMAEIVQKRRNRQENFSLQALPLPQIVQSKPAIALDPVCGMEIDIATAEHTYEFEGLTYYFCCNGCRGTFAKRPEKFIKPKIAIDPVCHMEVKIATAKYTSDYEGRTYYFCAAGCKMSFDKEPQAYLTPEQET